MATSEVQICNSSLIKLGIKTIIDFEDASNQAQVCKHQYPILRDEVLASHPWNFAIKRVQLPLLSSTPAFGWDSEYQLPVDCLRVLHPSRREYELDDYPFVIEGRKILRNSTDSPLNVKYIARITDVSFFSPQFSEALSLRLAADFGYALVQNRGVAEYFMSLYEQFMARARSSDAQEGTPEDTRADIWIDARSRGTGGWAGKLG